MTGDGIFQLFAYLLPAVVTGAIAFYFFRLHTRNEEGRRPVFGGADKFQNDPHWRDHILFYEYFHGDNGAGLGASHQTGWTGVIARLIQIFGAVSAEQFLEASRSTVFGYHD